MKLIKIVEQLTKPGKIWIKEVPKEDRNYAHDPKGFGFFGNTFELKDIFDKITKENLSYANYNFRFFWNRDFKCWWTLSKKSKEKAREEIRLRVNKNWVGDVVTFQITQSAQANTQPKSINKDFISPQAIEMLKQVWSKSGENSYTTEVSNLKRDFRHEIVCPSCYSSVNLNSFKSIKDGFEVTHSIANCKKCNSKLTIYND